jgi:hypothetical protein
VGILGFPEEYVQLPLGSVTQLVTGIQLVRQRFEQGLNFGGRQYDSFDFQFQPASRPFSTANMPEPVPYAMDSPTSAAVQGMSLAQAGNQPLASPEASVAHDSNIGKNRSLSCGRFLMKLA